MMQSDVVIKLVANKSDGEFLAKEFGKAAQVPRWEFGKAKAPLAAGKQQLLQQFWETAQ